MALYTHHCRTSTLNEFLQPGKCGARPFYRYCPQHFKYFSHKQVTQPLARCTSKLRFSPSNFFVILSHFVFLCLQGWNPLVKKQRCYMDPVILLKYCCSSKKIYRRNFHMIVPCFFLFLCRCLFLARYIEAALPYLCPLGLDDSEIARDSETPLALLVQLASLARCPQWHVWLFLELHGTCSCEWLWVSASQAMESANRCQMNWARGQCLKSIWVSPCPARGIRCL